MRSGTVTCHLLAAAVLAVSAGPALADEMWQSNWGEIVYDSDIDEVAVLTFEGGALLIDGLAGNYDARGEFTGLWVNYNIDEGEACETPVVDALGNEAWVWGRLDVHFVDAAFPSRWKADYTICDGPVAGTIAAEPI